MKRVVLGGIIALSACSGSSGPQGSQGPQGPAGPELTGDQLVALVNGASSQLAVDRLPVGSASGTVAPGNHAHTAVDVGGVPISGGTLTGPISAPAASFSGPVQLGSALVACDASRAGMLQWTGRHFTVCDGASWLRLAGPSGATAATAGASCRDIKARWPDATSGEYWIDPTGSAPVQIYCDMSFDGGGWTTIANTQLPGNTNVVAVTSPVADLQVRDPATANSSIWKWPGEAWTEFMIECRASATSPAVRWVFVRDMQTAAVSSGLNEIVANANNRAAALLGSFPCVVKHDLGGTYFCGNNHSVSETDWGDGLQVGNANPTWNSLLFGSVDGNGNQKCDQRTGYAYTSASGNMTASAIYTYRIR